MKTIKSSLALLFIALLLFSCGNDDDNTVTPLPNPPATSDTNLIRCNIDGVAYEATGSQITTLSDASAFNFRSDAATGIGMDFSIMGTPTVRSYSLNSSNGSTVGQLRYKTPDLYLTAKCSGSGTLTITAKNENTIEGTFSFIGYKFVGACSEPTKAITNGTFKVTL